MLLERSEVPPCNECDAFEENPWDHAAREICPECPWDQAVENPLLEMLLHYLSLLDSGCPVGRWELSDEQWMMLGTLKAEREKVLAQRTRERHGETD